MKRFLIASALALHAVSLSSDTASAWCFDVHRPKIEIPLPRIPIAIPDIRLFCADGCGYRGGSGPRGHGCQPPPHFGNGFGPSWYNTWPGHAYAPPGYGQAPPGYGYGPPPPYPPPGYPPPMPPAPPVAPQPAADRPEALPPADQAPPPQQSSAYHYGQFQPVSYQPYQPAAYQPAQGAAPWYWRSR